VTIAEKTDWQVARAQRLHLVQRMLRRQLQQVVPVLKTGRRGDRGMDFTGGSARVDFVAPLAPGNTHGSLYHVSLGILDDPERFAGAKKLVLRFRLLAPDDENEFPDGDDREYTILDDFTGGEFSYLDAAGNGDLRWQETWRDDNRIPALVRLSIRYADGETATWPDLVVAPRMAAASGIDGS